MGTSQGLRGERAPERPRPTGQAGDDSLGSTVAAGTDPGPCDGVCFLFGVTLPIARKSAYVTVPKNLVVPNAKF